MKIPFYSNWRRKRLLKKYAAWRKEVETELQRATNELDEYVKRTFPRKEK